MKKIQLKNYMNYKKSLGIIALFLSAIICKSSSAQVQIGTSINESKPDRIKPATLEAFKKTKTYFVLRSADYKHLEAFDKMLKRVWTVTPFEILDLENPEIKDASYSLFNVGGFSTSRTSGRGSTTTNTHLSYDLRLNSSKESTLLSKFMLHPDHQTTAAISAKARSTDKAFYKEVNEQWFGDGVFYGWSPTIVGCMLQMINDKLQTVDRYGNFEEYQDKEQLARLAQDTLYIPDFVLLHKGMLSFNVKTRDAEDVIGDYPFPYRVVTVDELETLAERRSDGIRFLHYIKSSTDKFIMICDSKDYRVWYTNYTGLSYNFEHSDIKRIARIIK